MFNYPAILNFANRDEFNYFTSECLDRSEFFTGVDMKYGDKFLTLSTCEFEVGLYDMRIVVVARKVVTASRFVHRRADKKLQA